MRQFADIFLVLVFSACLLCATDWNTYVLCSSTIACKDYFKLSKLSGGLEADDGYVLFDRRFSKEEMNTILADVHMTTMTHTQATAEIGKSRWQKFLSKPLKKGK